jgi:hypothetical protein
MVWNGQGGSYVREYSCDVGRDEKGNPANPSVACIVFCRIANDYGKWMDAIIVGLHAIFNGID